MWGKKKNTDTGADVVVERDERKTGMLDSSIFVFMAAVKSGMLQLEKDGDYATYNGRAYEKFWNLLSEDLDIRIKPNVMRHDQ